jgi:hypothetical protein
MSFDPQQKQHSTEMTKNTTYPMILWFALYLGRVILFRKNQKQL